MRFALLCVLFGLFLGCADASPAQDYGDPTSLNRATVQGGIVAWVVSPLVTETLTAPRAEIVIGAYVDPALDAGSAATRISVTLEPEEADARLADVSGTAGPQQRFRATIPLLHGQNPVRIRVASDDGAYLRRFTYLVNYQGASAGLRFATLSPEGPAATPCDKVAAIVNGMTASQTVCVRGRVTQSQGARPIERLLVGVAGGATTPVSLGADGAFEGSVVLKPDEAQSVAVAAVDATGVQSEVQSRLIQDSTPPKVLVTAAADGIAARTSVEVANVGGTASDANGISRLYIEGTAGGIQIVPATSPWTAEVRVDPGNNPIFFVAEDRAGNATRVALTVVRTRPIHLAAPQAGGNVQQLALDRFALESLLTADDQRSLRLVDVPLRPAIIAALQAIRDPVGHGVDTSLWKQAEWNLYRLLNMTPDTANLTGSSVAELMTIAAAIGIPPARMLAELLSIGVTSTFVSTEIVADVILEQLVGKHPNSIRDKDNKVAIGVSLYDALQNLRTLGPRFGPVAPHPGFLEGDTFSAVFESGFRMYLPVKSTLTRYDGLGAASSSKQFLFLKKGTALLEFDVDSSDFHVVGLVDQPTVDLRFVMHENAAFVRAGRTQRANEWPAGSGFFRGDSAVWSSTFPVWQIQSIVAETAYRQYRALYAPGYTKHIAKQAGSIPGDAAVIDWNRGWVTISTSGGIGSPPAPLYAWDLLVEVAQLRLHDGGIPYGGLDLSFTLKGLPIGLTADDLVVALRPKLKEQAAQLSERLLGTNALASSKADLFFVTATSGSRFLFFRAAEDDTASPYLYKTPGFFADTGLARKLSSKTLAGTDDVLHEKVTADAGKTLYFRDSADKTYQLIITAVDATGVTLEVAAVP
jgi:hypothetical protein